MSELPKRGSALIVGLGNPGSKYASHRHNIGFQVVEALARSHDMTFSRWPGSKARVAAGHLAGHPVLLAKPQTFMNCSGQAVHKLRLSNEIPLDRLLVVYDDLDLPLGRLRLRPEGGSGGHKGMRSIIGSLGTQGFPRLRVGIDRPPGGMDAADYVLQPFSGYEASCLAKTIDQAVAAVECWLAEGIETAMDGFNRPDPETESHCQEDQA
jgi:PTH1 family peptidyl-tRNA hydrolase